MSSPKENSASKGSAVGGFKIEWQVEGHKTENKLNKKGERSWVQNSEGENTNMRTVMNLVRESKVKKVSEDMVWRSLLKQRWSKEILGQSAGCLNESEQHEVIVKAAQELSLTPGYKYWVPEEDLAFGFKLFSIVHYCPPIPAKAAKLSFFFGNLLANYSLNTLVSAAMQNIQPKAGSNLKDFSAVHEWYKQIERRYNFFSLGQIVTALSSEEQLKRLSKLNPPYVKDFNAIGSVRQEGRSDFEPNLCV